MDNVQMLPREKRGRPLDERRILVVDDNQDAAQTLTRLLNVIGYAACAVNDGETAISFVEKSCPALIFLDLGMPAMDGVETARRIRQTPNGGEVVLVALTGQELKVDLARTQTVEFATYLMKPVSLPALERTLYQLVGVPGDGRSRTAK
jgi:CheY-like chemotaxis protein